MSFIMVMLAYETRLRGGLSRNLCIFEARTDTYHRLNAGDLATAHGRRR
jgi:hypothetical protein